MPFRLAAHAKWFGLAGLFVGISQMLRYMALAIAPVSWSRRSSACRFCSVSFQLADEPRARDLFGPIIVGTVLSLVGVAFLSVSTDALVSFLRLAGWLAAAAAWTWP